MNIETCATLVAVACAVAASISTAVTIVTIRRYTELKKAKAAPIVTELLNTRMGEDFLKASVSVRNAAHHLVILDEALTDTIKYSAGPMEETFSIYRGFVRKALHELRQSTDK